MKLFRPTAGGWHRQGEVIAPGNSVEVLVRRHWWPGLRGVYPNGNTRVGFLSRGRGQVLQVVSFDVDSPIWSNLALLYSSDKVLVWILLYECFMEQALTVITSGARLLALVGGTLSAVFIIWAGILWITASGDPQKMAQARMSLIGTVVGLVIIGIGFLVPG